MMRSVTIACLMLATIYLAGCTEVTQWDARGSWSGTLILPGEAGTSSQSSVGAGEAGRSEARIRMCELYSATFELPFSAAVRGEPAAVRIRTAEPLCRTGNSTVEGGSVLVWMRQSQDTLTVRAVPSDDWTVSGPSSSSSPPPGWSSPSVEVRRRVARAGRDSGGQSGRGSDGQRGSGDARGPRGRPGLATIVDTGSSAYLLCDTK